MKNFGAMVMAILVVVLAGLVCQAAPLHNLPKQTAGYGVVHRRLSTTDWNEYKAHNAQRFQDLIDGTVKVVRPAVIRIPDKGLHTPAGFNLTECGNPDNGWVYITPSLQRLSSLPPEGTRVSPQNVSQWTGLLASQPEESTLRIDYGPRMRRIRIIGLEFSRVGTPIRRSIVDVGRRREDDTQCSNQEEHPQHVIFDQCYIHGFMDAWGVEQREAITFNANGAIVDSRIEGTRSLGESKGVWINNSPRGISILNNSIEGGASCVFLGGSSIQTGEPNIWSDVLIKGNVLYHSRRWDPQHPSYVNHRCKQKHWIELKGGRRIGIYDNFCHTLYRNDDGQGYALVVNNTSQGGSTPWMEMVDIDVMYNLFRNSPHGCQVVGASNAGFKTNQGARIRISHNVFERTNEKNLLANIGIALSTGVPHSGLGLVDFEYSHNTDICGVDGNWNANNGSAMWLNLPSWATGTMDRVSLLDNITSAGIYCILKNGGAVKDRALDLSFESYESAGSVTIAGHEVNNPANQSNKQFYKPESMHWEDSIEGVAFRDASSRQWWLAPDSPYRKGGSRQATDSTDVGVDWIQLNLKLDGARKGIRQVVGPRPPVMKTITLQLTPKQAQSLLDQLNGKGR